VEARKRKVTRGNKAAKPGGIEPEGKFDADSYWKELIERFFWLLLQIALPELYSAADTGRTPKPLSGEFTDILNTGDPKIHKHPRHADFVMEVPLKTGASEWVILHIEAQGKGSDINFRMCHYRSAIFFHYRKEPVALAIITDKRPAKEAGFYSHSHFGTESIYRYNKLVLSELDDDALLTNDNPFGILLYAAKNALGTKSEQRKFRYMRVAMDRLAELGWNREDKHDLMLFIERIVNLKDEKLIARYKEHRLQLDREGRIVYIPLLEREKAKELIESGVEKGKLEFARNLLVRGISPDIIAESAGLPLEKIREIMN
jgi:predicted transposase/invertase (TIGR01784 family)